MKVTSENRLFQDTMENKNTHTSTHMLHDHDSLDANEKHVENLFPLITKSYVENCYCFRIYVNLCSRNLLIVLSSWAWEFRFYYLWSFLSNWYKIRVDNYSPVFSTTIVSFHLFISFWNGQKQYNLCQGIPIFKVHSFV